MMAQIPQQGRCIEIRGVVQGVGFRPWVFRLAHRDGISGRVSNDSSGVTIEAFGEGPALDAFCEHLRHEAPGPAKVRELHWKPIDLPPAEEPEERGFAIVASTPSEERILSIPPDLGICSECLRELYDPSDRRLHYSFLNCTHCGPRYTIALDVPYDRRATTMKDFELCPTCLEEYQDPNDRRFHAQPTACPECGPQLFLIDASGRELPFRDRPEAALEAAVEALENGSILAIKGLGGFHLACDATSEVAVELLRQRKHREEKPFAVMVRDLAAARALATLDELEEEILLSVERPIVLLRAKENNGLAAAVAPGLPVIGLFLPYTPLHHLLMQRVSRPLVMTSGNLSEEPISYRNEEALARLGSIADFFLFHDRPIARPCEDSVLRVVSGAPLLLRRARGYVPRPIELAQPVMRPILACGAHLKNTFCFAVGKLAYLGPHLGDLDNVASAEAFESSVADFERLLRVTPEVFAHDLHPEYWSTRYALAQPGDHVGVQHHHAHLLSAVAENHLEGKVYGVIFDGVGYGTDGALWGGEILLGDAEGFKRLATLRPLPLPGGDLAVRQVWRLALAALDDAFDGEPPLSRLPLFQNWPEAMLRTVRQMIVRRLHAPFVHGAGRYFDAVGALLLARPETTFEGQVAQQLGELADPREHQSYPFVLDRLAGTLQSGTGQTGTGQTGTGQTGTGQTGTGQTGTWQIDLRPALRKLTEDLVHHKPLATLAARFHNTLATAAASALTELMAIHGPRPVVLSGGCFANPLLGQRLAASLPVSTPIYRHQEVPPGDGGIALGQILAADAQTRRSSCA